LPPLPAKRRCGPLSIRVVPEHDQPLPSQDVASARQAPDGPSSDMRIGRWTGFGSKREAAVGAWQPPIQGHNRAGRSSIHQASRTQYRGRSLLSPTDGMRRIVRPYSSRRRENSSSPWASA